jgi:hypothetical protein
LRAWRTCSACSHASRHFRAKQLYLDTELQTGHLDKITDNLIISKRRPRDQRTCNHAQGKSPLDSSNDDKGKIIVVRMNKAAVAGVLREGNAERAADQIRLLFSDPLF